jgi:hypothetical protein
MAATSTTGKRKHTTDGDTVIDEQPSTKASRTVSNGNGVVSNGDVGSPLHQNDEKKHRKHQAKHYTPEMVEKLAVNYTQPIIHSLVYLSLSCYIS